MGKKPKTSRAAAKAGSTGKQKEQSERFVKAAREIGVDETGKEFETALKKLMGPKRSGTK